MKAIKNTCYTPNHTHAFNTGIRHILCTEGCTAKSQNSCITCTAVPSLIQHNRFTAHKTCMHLDVPRQLRC